LSYKSRTSADFDPALDQFPKQPGSYRVDVRDVGQVQVQTASVPSASFAHSVHPWLEEFAFELHRWYPASLCESGDLEHDLQRLSVESSRNANRVPIGEHDARLSLRGSVFGELHCVFARRCEQFINSSRCCLVACDQKWSNSIDR
jgi:hypothetical protein